MFTIRINRHTYRFSTLEAAKDAAAKIFTMTGVIVGIEQVAK